MCERASVISWKNEWEWKKKTNGENYGQAVAKYGPSRARCFIDPWCMSRIERGRREGEENTSIWASRFIMWNHSCYHSYSHTIFFFYINFYFFSICSFIYLFTYPFNYPFIYSLSSSNYSSIFYQQNEMKFKWSDEKNSFFAWHFLICLFIYLIIQLFIYLFMHFHFLIISWLSTTK